MTPTYALPLDCAPLRRPLDVRLSDSDLRRMEPVQQVLLRPLEYGSVDAWRSAVNQRLMTALGGDAAMFQCEVPGSALHYSDEMKPEKLATYVSEFMPELARTRQLYQRMRTIGAGNRSILWGSHLEWLYGSGYFNEYLAGLRAFDVLWACASPGTPRHPAMSERYPVVLHTYHATRDRGRRFDAVDVQLMRTIRPALEAGVETVLRVFDSRRELVRSIDHLGTAVFAFTAEGRLVHRNPAASDLADAAGGDDLCAAAEAVAREAAGASLPPDPSSGCRSVHTPAGTFRLYPSHLPPGLLDLSSTILVMARNPAERLPGTSALRERFGLTPRQAEVALLLADRLTNPEIAERLVLSPHTARRHTEAVLEKLGVGDRRLIAERLRTP